MTSSDLHLPDETLESWLTAAALDYEVPGNAFERVLTAAGEAPQLAVPLPGGARVLSRLPVPHVRVPHPRLVAAAILVVASVGAANLWSGHGSGATSAQNGAAVPATTGSSALHGTAGVGQVPAPLRAAANAVGGGADSATSGAASGSSSATSSASSAGGAAVKALAPGTTDSYSAHTQATLQGGTTTSLGSGAPAASDSAKIVHTGVLTLTVAKGKVSTTLTALDSLAAAVQGYVASTKTTESGDVPSGTVVLRVPADAYDSVLAQARRLGTVGTQTSSGKDVTAQTADLNARMTSLKKVRANYLTLLAKATTIGETLSVQQHVDDNQAQIDQLQGQINVLADQAAYGTLTVTVTQKAPPTPAAKPTHHKSGLAIAWDRAVNGFVTGIEALIARSGRAALVLILLLGGAIVLRTGWRLGRRRLV